MLLIFYIIWMNDHVSTICRISEDPQLPFGPFEPRG
jgi:hypothetical protein